MITKKMGWNLLNFVIGGFIGFVIVSIFTTSVYAALGWVGGGFLYAELMKRRKPK